MLPFFVTMKHDGRTVLVLTLAMIHHLHVLKAGMELAGDIRIRLLQIDVA